MNNTNIKAHLIDFSNGWEDYLNSCKRLVSDNYRYYVKSDHKIYITLVKLIVTELQALVDERIYKVKSSVGASTLAGIPWISIMDKQVTQSTQNGYYISYLFSKNAKKLYLSIALGATQFSNLYGENNKTTKKIIKAKEVFVENFNKYAPANNFEEMDLIVKEDDSSIRSFSPPMVRMAEYYEAGSFFTKTYDLVNPNFTESDFVDDIERYVSSYRKIVLDPSSQPLVDNLDEIVLEDSDKKLNSNLNYDIPSFNPAAIRPRTSTKKKGLSNKPKKPSLPSKKVGDAGEKHVYEYEMNKLRNAGREDLAEMIVKQYEDLSFFPGYDIQSFDKKGNKIYIEVKSTKNKKKDYFEISENELNTAKQFRNSYYIYQVTDALINPQISWFIKDLMKYHEERKILIEPMNYRISFKNNQ